MSSRSAVTGIHCLPLRLKTAIRCPTTQTSAPPAPLAPLQHLYTPFRALHETLPKKPIPQPTPFVPDTKTFLKLIGRGMSRYAPKLESWDKLFSVSSKQLHDEVGMVTARERRYLLRWLERFRRGRYGVGGDLDHVVDGTAELKVVAVPEEKMPSYGAKMERKAELETRRTQGVKMPDNARTRRALKRAPKSPMLTITPGMRYAIVNVPPSPPADLTSLPIKKYNDVTLQNGYMIRAPYFELTKAEGSAVHGMQGRLTAQEGMWEDKRRHRVGGGERKRREAAIAAKIAAQRKAAEEASGFSKQ